MNENGILSTLVEEVNLIDEKREYLDTLFETRMGEAMEKAHKTLEKFLKEEYNTDIEDLMNYHDPMWGTLDLVPFYRAIAWISYDDSIPEEYYNISSEKTVSDDTPVTTDSDHDVFKEYKEKELA